MRIVFDAAWWTHGPASTRRVVREIIGGWRVLFPDDELTVVVRGSGAVDVPDGVRVERSRFRVQALVARGTAASVARRVRADAVLTQNFGARLRTGVSAVYLHDVLFVTSPEWFTRVERVYFSLMVRWAPSADVVLTSSATEAGRIESATRARCVVPVGLGLSRELFAADAVPVDGLTAGSFLLSVGRLNARKNLGGAIAGALASGRLSPAFPLVVVGGADGLGAELDADARAAVGAGLIRFTGHVDDARLRWLYERCAAFVYVSLGEGYGMPPVEALAFGAAVVASDIPVFRETVGAHAVLVDPTDPDAVAVGIGTALARGRGAPVRVGLDWDEVVRGIRRTLVERGADDRRR